MNTAIKKLPDIEFSQLFVKGLKGILCLLMGVILVSLLMGVAKIAWDLQYFWKTGIENAFRNMIIHTLILLALIEVFRTLMAYLTEGRVKVTFIVDTVLVVMLTEVISLWFKGGDWPIFVAVAFILLALGALRIMAIRYSPNIKV